MNAYGLIILYIILGFFSLKPIQKNTVPMDSRVDGNYIGAFFKSNLESYPLYRSNFPKKDFIVKSADQLKLALLKAKKGDVIYLNDKSVFDFTNQINLRIPGGVTLYSGRGNKKSKGALILTQSHKTFPLFITTGDSVKISGIRFKGPDSTRINSIEIAKALIGGKVGLAELDLGKVKSYAIPNSNAIQIYHKGVEIENCEIYNWSYAGIYVRKGGKAFIHHNYIHHNQRAGLGYGITIDRGFALIRANIFDYNRHAIAGTGALGTSYTANYNIALEHSTIQGHIFDMHGGKDRKDGTDIAGDSIKISYNTFYVTDYPAIMIRGIPRFSSIINNNTLIKVTENLAAEGLKDKYSDDKKEISSLIKQSNKKGNLKIYNNDIRFKRKK